MTVMGCHIMKATGFNVVCPTCNTRMHLPQQSHHRVGAEAGVDPVSHASNEPKNGVNARGERDVLWAGRLDHCSVSSEEGGGSRVSAG